jgi:branched-chain amino acid transport system substrate-binding protein
VVQIALDQTRGIELAIDDFGPVRDHGVNLGPIVDDHCDSEGGSTGATAIGEQPSVVGVIGPTCSSAARPAAEILSDNGSVLISASSSDPSLTTVSGVATGTDWQPGFYRTASNDAQHGVAAANFAWDKLGAQSAVAIHLASRPQTKAVADAFADEFRDLGGEVRTVEATLSDLAADLSLLSDDPGDVIYFYTADGGEGAAIAFIVDGIPALSQVPLVSSEILLLDDEFLQDFPESVGMYFSVTELSLSGNVNAITGVSYDDLTDRYKAIYGKDPGEEGAHAYAYDATVQLLSAINEVAEELDDGRLSIDRQALRDALLAVENRPGLTGTLTCDQFGDCANQAFSIVQHLDMNRPELARLNVVYRYPP